MSPVGVLAQLANLTATEDSDPTSLPLHRLRPDPNQVRQVFDQRTLEELRDSIKVHGVLQSLLVQPPDHDGIYQIVAGERRWRAANLLDPDDQPETVPVRVLRPLPGQDLDLHSVQLVENLHNDELQPMEIAEALAHQRDNLGRSNVEIGALLGKPASWVSRYLGLLSIGDTAKAALANSLLTGPESALHFDALPEAVQREAIAANNPIPRQALRHLLDKNMPPINPTGRRGRPRVARSEPPSDASESPSPLPSSSDASGDPTSPTPTLSLVLPVDTLDLLFKSLGLKRPRKPQDVVAALVRHFAP